MEHISTMTACHASAQLLLCVRQETSYMRQGKQNSANAFYGYSATSFLQNIPYHCVCDRLICPHLGIHIVNLNLKKPQYLPPSSPSIHTSQSTRWGKRLKRTSSPRGSYIHAISLEHVIYIYTLIQLFVSADWPQLVVAHKYFLSKLM